MAKVKNIKCTDVGVSNNKSCDFVFTVTDPGIFSILLLNHYQNDKPHSDDIKANREDMFNVKKEKFLDNGFRDGEAKKIFEKAGWENN